jgi:hypothetical protein
MKQLIIEQSSTETYTSHSGLALVGLCLNRLGDFLKALKVNIPFHHGSSHLDLIKSYLGILCLGKSDFEAIEGFRNDSFFKNALSIKQVLSCSRLRQRLDEHAHSLLIPMRECLVTFLVHAKVPVTPLATHHVALDIDVYPMNNEKTKKEGISRTYKNYDGYAPIAAYLGKEGWCLLNELREGKQHCQKGFKDSLDFAINAAHRLTDSPLLLRLDSGHDALDSRVWLSRPMIDYILKWNPRKQDLEAWLTIAEHEGHWTTPREGKRVALFSIQETQEHQGQFYRFRRVMQVTVRIIDKKGQLLILPEIELEGWWTSLNSLTYSDKQIIALYQDHATSEQFHSEFKTDLDIERLPSGKFATNDLIMTLSAFSYNILRLIGLTGLIGDNSPVRHPAKRRRAKTVIQEFMYLGARVVYAGRRVRLRFSKQCSAFLAFESTYSQLAPG